MFNEKIINAGTSCISQDASNKEQNKENLIKEFLDGLDENVENICIFFKKRINYNYYK